MREQMRWLSYCGAALRSVLVTVVSFGAFAGTSTEAAEHQRVRAESPSLMIAQAQPRPPAAKSGAGSSGGGTGTTANTRLAADMHVNQGMTYAAMRDWRCHRRYSKAVDIDGRYASAYANRGVAYMQQRKYNKALDDLKQAESLNPNDKLISYNFVALYSVQNQLDRALDSLDRALEPGSTTTTRSGTIRISTTCGRIRSSSASSKSTRCSCIR